MKKIKVGIAGSRGLSTVMGLRALPDVEITALCNLDVHSLSSDKERTKKTDEGAPPSNPEWARLCGRGKPRSTTRK